MHRRRALEVLAAIVATPALTRIEGLTPRQLVLAGERIHERTGAPRTLDPEQYRQVEAVAEHILPRTETPGATDAKVADFVDVMFSDWYTPDERDRFLAGLRELDTRARQRRDTTFLDLAHTDQLAIVQQLDDEVVTLRATNASAANEHWFGTLKFLTVWGYHTSRVVAGQEERMTGRYDGNAPYRAANPS